MMRTMHSRDSINAPQLATATDRLLAQGRFTKRRGPHTARPSWSAYSEPEEITIRVARPR
jgi:hypothetical protein